MKGLVLLVMLSLGSCAPAFASSTCYAIADSDSRRVCLAKAHNDASRCYAVQDSEKRAICFAEVGK